jgi:hypothetical protein
MPRSSYIKPSFPNLILPDGWNTAWLAAKAAAGVTPARLLVWGDSISAGTNGASDMVNKSWVGLLGASLAAQLGGLQADYFPAWGFGTAGGVANPPWSTMLNGHALSNVTNFGWHTSGYYNGGLTTDAIQRFTSPVACTDMDLFYLDYNSGTFKYSVDGGAQQVLTCSAAGNGGNSSIKRQQISGLSNTTHTLDIGWQSAGAVLLPMGAAIYPSGRSAGGLALARFCNGGQAATDYVAGTIAQNGPTDRIKLLGGVSPQGDAGTYTSPFGYPTQPHLGIFAMGANDCNNGKSGGDWATAIKRFIQACRRGVPNASVLLLVVCNPDSESSDGTGFQPGNWFSYWNVCGQFPALYNVAVASVHARWGETPVANGFLTGPNTVHPTDAGHADIANFLLPVL